MKPITYIVGDATRPQATCPVVVAHCCNDIGAWGAGFVLALSRRWPKSESSYREWARQVAPRQLPLGRVGIVEVEKDIFVANIIGQRDVGPTRGVSPIRYTALREGLRAVAAFAVERNASVHMPRLGCGLAGGEWREVQTIIEDEICATDIAAFVYDLPGRKAAA